MPKSRVYMPTKHRFFDSLVTLLALVDALSNTFHLHHGKSTTGFASRTLEFQGMKGVSGIDLLFADAASLTTSLCKEQWPNRLELLERAITNSPNFPVGFSVGGIQRLHSQYFQAVFIHFYESVVPLVVQLYGKKQVNWPDIWNFGRVVRNAFAHGGCVRIDDPNSRPVNWGNLTYSYSDNGRNLLFNDLCIVELILLMEEMDALL